MTTRNTTKNCWGTPEWRIEKVVPTMKRIWKILEKDNWLMIIHSYVKLCNDITEKTWHSGKKEEQLKSRILMNLRNKELITWMNKNKNYVMHILHQFKLMISNGFGILLILVERIKRDIAQTWEGLQRTTGRIETTNKLIWEHRKRNLEQTTVRIENESSKGTIHWEELENEWRYLTEFRYKWTKRSRAD